MNKKIMVCIVCPIGCQMDVEWDDINNKIINIEGNTCKRGEKYAIQEFTNPTRIITSTVIIKGVEGNRLPVKTVKGVPKEMIFDCMGEINRVIVDGAVKVGEVIIKDILGTGVDVVASRSMK